MYNKVLYVQLLPAAPTCHKPIGAALAAGRQESCRQMFCPQATKPNFKSRPKMQKTVHGQQNLILTASYMFETERSINLKAIS